MKETVTLKSTDGTTSREVHLNDVKFVIRREGQKREKAKPATKIALADGSTNVLNVFAEDGTYLCAIGFDHGHYHSSGGLFICA